MVAFVGVNAQHAMGNAALARWGYVSEARIYEGASWGLLTNAFVHFEPLHLIFNLYWIWILGGAFERTFGPVRMFLFVICSAVVSSGLQLYAGSGIGLSGVGYALFGFSWVGRRRYPQFARVVNDRTVQMFVLWGVGCIVATYLHLMNIGNVAHFSGLLFGAGAAGLILASKGRIWIAAGLALLATGSIGALFWNPRSNEWVSEQAMGAEVRHDYPRAIKLYERALALGADPEWCWTALAENYGFLQMEPEYRAALNELDRLDPTKAAKVVKEYGDPRKP